MRKDVRIQMPKMKVDEETDIIAYDAEQVQKLDEYFIGTNAETAYMLGRYCGLRINAYTSYSALPASFYPCR